VYGLLAVYSSTHVSQAAFHLDSGYFLKRQLLFLAAAVGAMVVTVLIDYRVLKIYAPFVYLAFVLALLLVRIPGIGKTALGAQRWFQVGAFQLSPSLFMRLALILMLAAYLSGVKGELTLGKIVRAVLIAVVPMFLVFIQPDIGTSIVLGTILVVLLIAAGARARYLIVLALVGVLAIFGAFRLNIIQDYQLARLTSFWDPSQNTQTASYNLHQSEIAIGAGGLAGRGYLQGSQTNLAFVPEQHTDFIFSVAGEELGFAGTAIIIALLALVILRALRIAARAEEPFGTLVAGGVAVWFAVQAFVNIGMTVGIMPVTGLPLPFVSYGGSSMFADMIAIGMLMAVRWRPPRFV
jgi:rod shape determining protein RodA